MSTMRTAIYEPPKPRFPYLAVTIVVRAIYVHVAKTRKEAEKVLLIKRQLRAKYREVPRRMPDEGRGR